MLGPNHRITRAEITLRQTRDAVVVCMSLAISAGASAGWLGERAIAVAASALVVGAISGVIHAAHRISRRSVVHEEILAGRTINEVPAFREEVARLRSPALRDELCAGLSRALHDAEHWHELLVASRPPPSVRRLAEHRRLVHGIIDALARPGAPSLRAAVLLERLIKGGYGSPLYESGQDQLARELTRIHYELTSAQSST